MRMMKEFFDKTIQCGVLSVHLQVGKMWPDISPLVAAAAAALVKTLEEVSGEVTIRFSDDEDVHALNHQFRGKDKPTNVLSFPADGDDGYLGDIILAYETIAHEAELSDKPFGNHVAHLVLHGMLHLLGFDHIQESEALEMEALETTILALLNIDDPYSKE